MNSKYLYLTIDLLCISIPFLFSFHPKNNFYKKWLSLWPAILLPAAFFILWDIWFTGMGVWGFNPKYVTGIYLVNLPIEEVLFFICVPYACTFSYEAISVLSIGNKIGAKTYNLVTDLLIVALVITAVVMRARWYPGVTFSALACFLIFLRWKIKPSWLGRFYFSFLFMLIPFFIVNGVLTGTGISAPVVWYNQAETLGIRIATIPFEDVFYGLLLIMMNVSIFEYLKKTPTRSGRVGAS